MFLLSLTPVHPFPHLTAFTGTLQSANVMELKGLSHTTKVMGCGPVLGRSSTTLEHSVHLDSGLLHT